MMNMGNVDFAEWLIEQTESRGWSYRELGRRAGLSSGAVSKVVTGAALPGSDFCLGVARAFNMSPVDVFRRAGILPPAPKDDPHLLNLLHLAARLPDDDLVRLLAIARTFYDEAEREGRLEPERS